MLQKKKINTNCLQIITFVYIKQKPYKNCNVAKFHISNYVKKNNTKTILPKYYNKKILMFVFCKLNIQINLQCCQFSKKKIKKKKHLKFLQNYNLR